MLQNLHLCPSRLLNVIGLLQIFHALNISNMTVCLTSVTNSVYPYHMSKNEPKYT